MGTGVVAGNVSLAHAEVPIFQNIIDRDMKSTDMRTDDTGLGFYEHRKHFFRRPSFEQ